MNGIGLLITILFCTIIWWGTSRYYKRIIIDVENQNRRLQADLTAVYVRRDWEARR